MLCFDLLATCPKALSVARSVSPAADYCLWPFRGMSQVAGS